MEERGHNVWIYYPDGDYQPGEREIPFKSVEFSFYRGYRIALPMRIAKHTRQLDVVHEHGLYGMAIAGWMASRAHKIPKVLTFHTPGDEYLCYLTKNRMLTSALCSAYMLWERKLLNSFNHVTTASPAIKERLDANGIGDVEVLSNGIDLGVFHHADPTGFKKKQGLDGKVIGFCGRLGIEKHLEDLINAADRFDGTVLIAGKGPAEEHYKKLAEGRENVRFLGFLDRDTLRHFYSALDVFVFPSVAETQGLVALEAMACGTPVVGVPVLALKNTIEDGVTGYHYSRGDVGDLLEKVEKAYDNMDGLSINCLKEAENNSVDKTVDRLEELYTGLTR